ncbi:MAG: peptidoglycan DD-metalloendopeptidase family protein [Bacilli bacterium]|nr:peptidoglycan DD-metalloendopeptidase family protein [Bacilli bacterium]
MKTKEKTIIIMTGILMSILMILIGFPKKNMSPQNVYQVYLDGTKIGLVDNKENLLNLINEEQQDIKSEYKVNQVYPPNGFDIEEYVTYDESVENAENIYKKIQEKGDFTIEGYLITITRPASENATEKVTSIAVVDEQIFKDAEYKFITTFVDEADYQKYITNTQEEIKTVGSFIKHMEFAEGITIKKAFISVKSKIFTDASELTQYLLYGTTTPQNTYTVKQGDTLASIAEESKLNVRELLIANPKYKTENAVLAIGDSLSNAVINPVLNLYEEVRMTEDVEQAYQKQTVTDNTLKSGEKKITQTGVTGLVRTTQELRVINGERSQETNLINSVTIRESIPEVTSVGPSYKVGFGSKSTGGYYNTGLNWIWPTKTPYVITTDYEYRWGSFHNAIDISGTGFGSPIYASRGGTVIEVNSSCANYGYLGSNCGMGYGNFIVIQHENNYYTIYAHITQDVKVSVGQQVSQGQLIASMGSSGSSTGTHLHFGFAVGSSYSSRTWYNPWSLFR